MIANLSDYFEPEHEYYLNSVSYNRIDTNDNNPRSIKCTDNVSTEVIDETRLKLVVTRTLEFQPNGIFYLSVSYGANLKFVPEKYSEYNWHDVDLSKEFVDNGKFVTLNLLNRISLLIGEITSSYGQMPLIIAPSFIKE